MNIMAVVRNLAATGLGSIIAVVGIVMVLANSLFFTFAGEAHLVYRWTLVFLFGLFVLCWGLASLVSG